MTVKELNNLFPGEWKETKIGAFDGVPVFCLYSHVSRAEICFLKNSEKYRLYDLNSYIETYNVNHVKKFYKEKFKLINFT